MNKTKIESVKNPDGTQGYTWNPLSGCLYHTPEGLCLGGMFPCFAYKLANGRLKSRYLANKNLPTFSATDIPYGEVSQMYIQKCFNDPFYPRLWEDRMWLPELVGTRRKPKGIFVCDMSDLFGIGVPEEWTRRILAVIEKHPRHRFYLLTKQQGNLIKFSPFPDNCRVGVTVTSSEFLGRACYIGLARINAKVKFLSFEPLLGKTQLHQDDLRDCGISWVIIGAQTKPTVYPKIEWVEEIELATRKAGVPIFEKDNLKPLLNRPLIQEVPNA